jgi:hypothetical protein
MDATFFMSNMVPQAPDLNRGTWEKLEEYCRSQAHDGDETLYVVAGPAGKGGVGSEGPRDELRRRVVVPSHCWKVVLVVPSGVTDPAKVTSAEARVFSVIMPNQQGLEKDWRKLAVPVSEVEKLTGYTFFDRLPRDVAEDLRARKPETRAKAERAPPKVAKVAKGKEAATDLELREFVKGCVVGNRQTKKYHVPGGRYYESGIKSKHAVFFRTAADAEKAGYTAAKR